MAEATYHPLSPDLSMNINLQEYFLQGAINETYLEKLRDRLKGVCDNTGEKRFRDLEKTYSLAGVSSSSSVPINITAKASKSMNNPDVPWQLRYIGPTDTGDRSKNVMIRSNVTVAVSDDPTKFLEELGFMYKFQTEVEGYFYRKGRVKVIVAKLLPSPNSYDPTKLQVAQNSYLIEISALSQSGDKTASDEVYAFGQLLYPIVPLERLDPRLLQRMQ